MTSTTNQPAGSSGTEKVGESIREEAGHVQQTTAEAARDVAETAKEQVADVVSEAQQETRRLIRETRDQVGQQAEVQRDQAVQGLRSLSDELRKMAEHGSGWGAQLARQGAGWSDRTAGFLDGRELTDIVEDVRTLARRRPGRFLAGAVVAGVVAGRMSRAMAAGPPQATPAALDPDPGASAQPTLGLGDGAVR